MKAPLAAFALLVAAVLVSGLLVFHYIPDDTYITLRYARNVLGGTGFVYNAGERVEGYTNFLWLLLLVVAGKAGAPLVLSARTLSLVFSIGTLALLPVAAREKGALAADRAPEPEARRESGPAYPGDGRRAAFALMLPSLIVAASPPFLTWALSGTEIPLFMFLLLWAFILIRNESRSWAALIVLALLGLVRPEGAAVFACALVFLLARRGRSLRAVAAGLAVSAALFAPYLRWKWSYYHSLLPNTFYAKTGPLDVLMDNGSRYVFGFILCYGYLFIVGWYLLRRRGDRAAGPLALFVLPLWLSYLFLGGDWMPNYRLLLPTLPFAALAASRGLQAVAGTERRRTAPLLALVILFLVSIPGITGYERLSDERLAVGAFARLGERLREILPPSTSIGCGSTGAIGYFTEMPIVDILGLTDPVIARSGRIVARQPGHLKADGARVMELAPDLLLLGNIQIHRGNRDESAMRLKVQEKEIASRPEFSRDYVFVNIPLGSGFNLSCYKRRDFFLPL